MSCASRVAPDAVARQLRQRGCLVEEIVEDRLIAVIVTGAMMMRVVGKMGPRRASPIIEDPCVLDQPSLAC